MFIQVEETPNPHVIKFLLDEGCVSSDVLPLSFTEAKQASCSPFAQRLFDIEGVVSVFFGEGFVAIGKEEGEIWPHLKPFLFSTLVECLTRKIPIFKEIPSSEVTFQVPNAALENYDPEIQGIVTCIIETLEKYIQPAVAQDGGHVSFSHYDHEKDAVYLVLRGACSGCPSAQMTLKNGIERTLKFYCRESLNVFEAQAEEHNHASL